MALHFFHDGADETLFQYLKKILLYLKTKYGKSHSEPDKPPREPEKLGTGLDETIARVKTIFGKSPDVFIREFNIARQPDCRAALVLIDGITNMNLVNLNILRPLMFDMPTRGGKFRIETLEDIDRYFIPFCNTSKALTLDDVTDKATSGAAILFVDGLAEALAIGVRQWESRAIEEPSTESVIRGPREGFTESISVNVSMLRRRVKNPNLQFIPMKIGRQTKTDVLVSYIDGVVDPVILEEVQTRLKKIETDSVLDSGYISAYIQDAPYSVFPTVGNSERPDVISARLLEGCVAILVDGSPFVLTQPMLFMENFQSPQDYYIKFHYASLMRMLRCFSYFVATMTPAIYVALTTYHQDLIPTTLLYTMVAGHKGVPFPAIMEAIIMLFFFDVMFEAGLRLPKAVGSAVSIVGALVIGQSAVSAGLVSPFMVIVVALTAITSFVVSPQTYSTLVLRYYFTILGGALGGYGILMGLIVVLFHMFSLKSFGVPYLSLFYSDYFGDFEDSFVIIPIWKMLFRPQSISSPNRRRRASAPSVEEQT